MTQLEVANKRQVVYLNEQVLKLQEALTQVTGNANLVNDVEKAVEKGAEAPAQGGPMEAQSAMNLEMDTEGWTTVSGKRRRKTKREAINTPAVNKEENRYRLLGDCIVFNELYVSNRF